MLPIADCITDCVWLKPVGTDVRKLGYLPFVWLKANERESATRKYGQHLVAPRNEIGRVVKGKLGMLFRRFVLLARNAGGNRENDNKGKLGPQFAWPYVMNSSVAMRGPLVSGTWIWHHQHARWHHGYYRTRR
jgi:hypothetical protein